ncbi:PTS sugar transporter subunit IIA [Aquabacterium sp.]|uniref:PTS sugar transporter subunit IIA n=1 Tax=Aquabacterium sp. TaxID=1872578 RepID=UPI0019C79E8D|nr:PTS sugar transporter subunit IIA [Aquabacterium sp.]MBC7699103.1 PTS sugar transporter subunit IIA [Aquabacterium sp.]
MVNSMTKVKNWLQPQKILLDVDVRDQADALKFIAESVGQAHGLDTGAIFRALSRREQAASTALGDGFAIPHARIGGIERPLTLFIRTKRGLDFLAPDGRPVSDLLAIIVPLDGDKDDHLRLLSLVVRLFSDRDFRRGLDTAPSAAAAQALFQVAIAHMATDDL